MSFEITKRVFSSQEARHPDREGFWDASGRWTSTGWPLTLRKRLRWRRGSVRAVRVTAAAKTACVTTGGSVSRKAAATFVTVRIRRTEDPTARKVHWFTLKLPIKSVLKIFREMSLGPITNVLPNIERNRKKVALTCLFLGHLKGFFCGVSYGLRDQFFIKRVFNFSKLTAYQRAFQREEVWELGNLDFWRQRRAYIRTWSKPSGIKHEIPSAILPFLSLSLLAYAARPWPRAAVVQVNFPQRAATWPVPAGPSLPITLSAKPFLHQYALYRIWSSDTPDSHSLNESAYLALFLFIGL